MASRQRFFGILAFADVSRPKASITARAYALFISLDVFNVLTNDGS
jgi:hypothetical protein